MGVVAAGVNPVLDRVLSDFYRRAPVTATFIGVHEFDEQLPDWSSAGRAKSIAEMRSSRSELARAGAASDSWVDGCPEQVDLALLDAALEIQIAELESEHFYGQNPALWTGEAIFSVIALVTRPFAPLHHRLRAAAARMEHFPEFFRDARAALREMPDQWGSRALRELQGAAILFSQSLPAWLADLQAGRAADGGMQQNALAPALVERARRALAVAARECQDFAAWIAHLPAGKTHAAGEPLLSLLLRRGHWCREPVDELRQDALAALEDAHAALDAGMRQLGHNRWLEVEAKQAADHPSPTEYLDTFTDTWNRFRTVAAEHDLVTWPEAPIRYVPIPAHTRDAAPFLYYLFYRSPAPFDAELGSDGTPLTYDYVVPALAGIPPEEAERRLRAANRTTIALNHVVHHGGLGHHVQNWFARRSPSNVGQIAATDAASRIALFCGGTMAEGWACYACDLMDEIGALQPLERVSVLHTRVRLAARAVVDFSLHTGTMSFDEAVAFFQTRGWMPAAAAQAEAVKASMFPGTASMYWLGTRGIHALRSRVEEQQRESFSLRAFHDRLLGYGSLPVALIAQLLLAQADRQGPSHVLLAEAGGERPLRRPPAEAEDIGPPRRPLAEADRKAQPSPSS